MKVVLGGLLAAACSSQPTFGPPVACSEAVASLCPGSGCPTLGEELSHVCSDESIDGYAECGGWVITYTGEMDDYRETYFFEGTFVAQLRFVPELECIGPASFSPPSCAGTLREPSRCP